MKTRVKCPTCGKLIEWSEQRRWRPFCSERCRMIDLGSWADEDYRIKGERVSPEGGQKTE
jgi:endogenous inhibitor of DNA gyrase (YacG/DUF329 family)